MAASTAVFTTYELLKSILQQVSMYDLVRARRVSKEWHSLVKQSLPLRQKLFLAPISSDYLSLDETRTVAINNNGTLVTKAPLLAPPKSQSLTRLPLPKLKRSSCTAEERRRVGTTYICPRMYNYWWKVEFMRATAASTLWRKAFITQPPCTTLALEVSAHICEPGICSWLQIATGITLGDIVDTFERMLDCAGEEKGNLELNWSMIIE